MKGLLKTISIISADIVIATIASIIISSSLNNRLTAAYERGYEEGDTQDYLVGFQEGSEVGYQEGSKIGYAKANPGDNNGSDEKGFYFLYTPTYDELRETLTEGKTGSVTKVHKYAETNDIRAAYVRIRFEKWGHAVVAFETVDRGPVFIEPQSDTRAEELIVGKAYPW